MKKFFSNLKYNLKYKIYLKIYNIKHNLEIKKYKKMYPDYEDDDRNIGELKFIWGVVNWDDLTGKYANLYTLNIIEITYNREIKKYSLGIETQFYCTKDREMNECKHLKHLLDIFTSFMDNNNYSKDFKISIFNNYPEIKTDAESIEELYANFKMYVTGYCVINGFSEILNENKEEK